MNLYDILGVQPNATFDDIKIAFRKLAMKWHPDREGGDNAKFQEIQNAYEILTDDDKRKEYDATGKVGSEEEFQAEVMTELAELLQYQMRNTPDIRFTNIIEMMKQHIRKEKGALSEAEAQIRQGIKKYADAKDRISAKGENFLSAMLQGQIDYSNSQLNTIARTRRKYKKMLETLDNFSYRTDQRSGVQIEGTMFIDMGSIKWPTGP